MPLDPTVQSSLIGAGGVAFGTVIASIFNWLGNISTRRSEERKIIYDIASKLAVEQWKLDVECTDAANKIIEEKGIWNIPTGIDSFRIPIPHIAHTVQRIITEIDTSTRPKSWWSRFQAWREARRNRRSAAIREKKEEAEPQSRATQRCISFSISFSQALLSRTVRALSVRYK